MQQLFKALESIFNGLSTGSDSAHRAEITKRYKDPLNKDIIINIASVIDQRVFKLDVEQSAEISIPEQLDDYSDASITTFIEYLAKYLSDRSLFQGWNFTFDYYIGYLQAIVIIKRIE